MTIQEYSTLMGYEYTRNGSIDGCAFREIFKIQG